MLLTADGLMLTFGRGDSGMLGHGDQQPQFVPKVVDALQGVGVCQLAAGPKHSMVRTEDGRVFTFGRGSFGKLGHGDQQDQLVPKVVDALQGVCVCQIAAGDCHSMVLAEDGRVLTFGDGETGKLGHGDAQHQLVPRLVTSL